MGGRPLLRFVIALGMALGAWLASGAARAHEFAMESVMNAFVTVEDREARMVVRLPLHAIKPARLPVTPRAEIDLANARPAMDAALEALSRDLVLYQDGVALVPRARHARISLPSDRSFENEASARAHVASAMPADLAVIDGQGYFDADLVYAVRPGVSRYAIQTRVAPELKDYLKLSVRYSLPGQPPRAMVITSRSGEVALNPAWYQAMRTFIGMGVVHILSGTDHLLFLLCLIIPLRGAMPIVTVVTLFTIAHSLTLVGAALGLVPRGPWFPPFVEAAIAASIVYLAIENIVGAKLSRRGGVTALFGLVHGFGFSYGLQENLQFAGSQLAVSLLSFNIGIELGQLAAVAVMLPLLALVRRYVLKRRMGVIILSAMVANVAWSWMVARLELLWKVEWPRPGPGALAALAAAVAVLCFAVAAWRLRAAREGVTRRRAPEAPTAGRSPPRTA